MLIADRFIINIIVSPIYEKGLEPPRMSWGETVWDIFICIFETQQTQPFTNVGFRPNILVGEPASNLASTGMAFWIKKNLFPRIHL